MADDFLEDDPNATVKGAIAERQNGEKDGELNVAKILATRLERIIPDQHHRDTFVNQVTVMREANQRLANCTPRSIIECMIACGHLDLLPNTAQQYAYIIPYGTEAQFQLGYKGLIELAFRSGQINSINAELVFEEDEFEVTLGGTRKLIHKPNYFIDRSDFNRAQAVYATATLANGATTFHVMTMFEITKIRDTSKAGKGKDSPWTTWPEAMAKKTVIKQFLKLLPSSTEDNRFKEAIVYDDYAEAGKLHFDHTNRLDTETPLPDDELDQPPTKPKDKGVKNYAPDFANIKEAEVIETPPSHEEAKPSLGMTKAELIDAITEMFNMLKFDDLQRSKVYETVGTTSLADADMASLEKVFAKLDGLLAN